LKLEGEVLLDVEFAASGSVSILQVVRGLGHGLDEAAASAAKQIRFKPAQSAGRPINFRTTVHIVFRLA
jgi:protein TonB